MNYDITAFIDEVGKAYKEQLELKKVCIDQIISIIKDEVDEGYKIDLFNSDLPHSALAVLVPHPIKEFTFTTCWVNQLAVLDGKLQILCGEQGDGDGFWYEPKELIYDLSDLYQILKFLQEWCGERASVKETLNP